MIVKITGANNAAAKNSTYHIEVEKIDGISLLSVGMAYEIGVWIGGLYMSIFVKNEKEMYRVGNKLIAEWGKIKKAKIVEL